MKRLYTITAFIVLVSCGDEKPGDPPVIVNNVPEPAKLGYTVLNIYPHDTASFTQGLQWHKGYLYEGTGMKGESHLMKVKLENGKAVQKISLDPSFFGEGITILGNKIYQLTWTEHKIFVYDLASFKKIQEFAWDHEGWGITNNGKELIISTGGSNIYFADPETLRILSTISVSSNYGPMGDINELEYVNGKIYANVWGRNEVFVINPQSGAVEARLDFEGLLEKSGKNYGRPDVLNGIAYDSVTKRFFITGKRWPALFEIKLDHIP